GLLFDGGRRDGGRLEGGGSAGFLLFAALGQLLTRIGVFRQLVEVLASRRHCRGGVHRSAISACRTAARRATAVAAAVAAGAAAAFAAAFRPMEAAFEALPQ